jgi:DNA polymerase-3 subunit delta'
MKSPKLPISQTLVDAHGSRLQPLVDRYAREQAMHSTLLFTGIDGVGKKSIVLHFLQILFCDESVFNGKARKTACGECKSCKRAQMDQWLDLFWFEPESNDEERYGTHKIEPFRELKTKLGMGATEEPFKVVVIADADRMTIPAANSILKMLEEPPRNWIFILTAADSSRLLPTILSRCLEVRLQPLNDQQIFDILKEAKGLEFNSKRGEVAARAGMGSIRRAQLFLDEETWKLREQLLGLLSNPGQDWMKVVEGFSASQRAMTLGFDLLESIFHDLLLNQVSSSHAWIHQDQREFLRQWAEAKRLDAQRIEAILTRIAENRRFATMTLNSKLLAQQTLIPLLESIV